MNYLTGHCISMARKTKTSYPEGLIAILQAAGVRTSYVVDMSAPDEAAMKLDGVVKNFHFARSPALLRRLCQLRIAGDISGTKWHDTDGDGARETMNGSLLVKISIKMAMVSGLY